MYATDKIDSLIGKIQAQKELINKYINNNTIPDKEKQEDQEKLKQLEGEYDLKYGSKTYKKENNTATGELVDINAIINGNLPYLGGKRISRKRRSLNAR